MQENDHLVVREPDLDKGLRHHGYGGQLATYLRFNILWVSFTPQML